MVLAVTQIDQPVGIYTALSEDDRGLKVEGRLILDVARAKEIIRSTALLELKLVEGGPASTKEALLSATGGTFSNPATNYFHAEGNPLKVAENVARSHQTCRREARP